jgi:hypothetical protein
MSDDQRAIESAYDATPLPGDTRVAVHVSINWAEQRACFQFFKGEYAAAKAFISAKDARTNDPGLSHSAFCTDDAQRAYQEQAFRIMAKLESRAQ